MTKRKKYTVILTFIMLFTQIKVLPSYQAVVYKNNSFLRVVHSGLSQIFTGWTSKQSVFAVLLPINTQLVSVDDLMVVTRQNFSFLVSFSIEYKIIDAEKFAKSYNIVQVNENGFRIPLSDFESKLEMHAKTLFLRAARSVSLPRFAADTDYKFGHIKSELLEMFDLTGVSIEGAILTEIRITHEAHSLMLNQLTLENTSDVKFLPGASTRPIAQVSNKKPTRKHAPFF